MGGREGKEGGGRWRDDEGREGGGREGREGGGDEGERGGRERDEDRESAGKGKADERTHQKREEGGEGGREEIRHLREEGREEGLKYVRMHQVLSPRCYRLIYTMIPSPREGQAESIFRHWSPLLRVRLRVCFVCVLEGMCVTMVSVDLSEIVLVFTISASIQAFDCLCPRFWSVYVGCARVFPHYKRVFVCVWRMRARRVVWLVFL